MADSAIATQTALIARYRGDATLQGLMTGASGPEWNIFDHGGGGNAASAFPYVLVHPITGRKGSLLSFGQDAQDFAIQVDVFTDQEGFSQARTIIARIYALSDGPSGAAPLVLSGFTNVITMFDGRQELEETHDILVQHIADRYKIQNQG